VAAEPLVAANLEDTYIGSFRIYAIDHAAFNARTKRAEEQERSLQMVCDAPLRITVNSFHVFAKTWLWTKESVWVIFFSG